MTVEEIDGEGVKNLSFPSLRHNDRNSDLEDEDDGILDLIEADENDKHEDEVRMSGKMEEETVECESVENDQTASATSTGENAAGKKQEAPWEEVWNDSIELDDLIFSIRRKTARRHLAQMVAGLKLLSEKLRRLDEIQLGIQKREETNETQQAAPNQNKRPIETNQSAFQNSKRQKIDESTNNNSDKLTSPPNTNSNTEQTQTNTLTLTHTHTDDLQTKKQNESEEVDLSDPPSLKKKDKWVQHHASSNQISQSPNNVSLCPDFKDNHTCPLGSSCNRWHVYKSNVTAISYTKEDLEHVYLTYRSVPLQSTDFSQKIKPDGWNRPRYACSLICPLDRTIYYSNGVGPNSFKSKQNIWWYFHMKHARDAIATIVITHLKQRGIVPTTFKTKTIAADPRDETRRAVATQMAVHSSTLQINKAPLPSTLPLINPWNWMEIQYKHGRCPHFNTPNGCQNGSACPFAHVYYPKFIPSTESCTSSLSASVLKLYRYHFQYNSTALENFSSNNLPSLRTRSALDDKNQSWYTAAWQCPIQNTIYYAAGGDGRIQQIQNMYLYPTQNKAQVALWSIILQAWEQQGIKIDIYTLPQTPTTMLTDPRSTIFQQKDEKKTQETDNDTALRDPKLPISDIEIQKNGRTFIKQNKEEKHKKNNENPMISINITNDESSQNDSDDISENLFGSNDESDKENNVLNNDATSLETSAHSDEDELENELFGGNQDNDGVESPLAMTVETITPEIPFEKESKRTEIIEFKHWPLLDQKDCRIFRENNECPLGAKCPHAHVYSNKDIPANYMSYPDDTLVALYLTCRGFHLTDQHFQDLTGTKKDVLDDGRLTKSVWYTCALICPLDNIVYHTPMVNDNKNEQALASGGLYWYSSQKKARAALTVAVLSALRKRKILPSIDST